MRCKVEEKFDEDEEEIFDDVIDDLELDL